jgi:hypothetical protein
LLSIRQFVRRIRRLEQTSRHQTSSAARIRRPVVDRQQGSSDNSSRRNRQLDRTHDVTIERRRSAATVAGTMFALHRCVLESVRSLTTLFDTPLQRPPACFHLMIMGPDLFCRRRCPRAAT